MQWNQPLGNLTFENNLYNTNPRIPNPQIIGEGEVSPIYFPDGSIQLCFVPTMRHDYRSPYQCNTNVPYIYDVNKPTGEYWFVRTITYPSFNNRPYVYGDHLSTQFQSPNHCLNSLPYPDYYQKFHNDNTTSTTDILYFYPGLRPERKILGSASAQTDTATTNYNFYNGASRGHCNCKVSFKLKKGIDDCVYRRSVSSMSIDSVQNTSEHSLKSKKACNNCEKHKRIKTRKHKDHPCSCNLNVKQKSDKMVSTYIDQACSAEPREGRETQTTVETKQNDVNTELWTAIKGNCIKESDLSVNTIGACSSCFCSIDCDCTSATESEFQ